MMTQADPDLLTKLQQAIEKNHQERWGLTLVSFVADESGQLEALRCRLQEGFLACRAPVTFALPGQIHVTHLTLTRSQTEGPVKAADLLKPDAKLYQLFEVIQEVTATAAPLSGQFTTLQVAKDRAGLVLIGASSDPATGLQRGRLQALDQALSASFQVERKWEQRPLEYFCSFGYLQVPVPPEIYDRFVDTVQGQKIEPVDFILREVALVHHHYRTLASPHAGSVVFPLGKTIALDPAIFARDLNLA